MSMIALSSFLSSLLLAWRLSRDESIEEQQPPTPVRRPPVFQRRTVQREQVIEGSNLYDEISR